GKVLGASRPAGVQTPSQCGVWQDIIACRCGLYLAGRAGVESVTYAFGGRGVPFRSVLFCLVPRFDNFQVVHCVVYRIVPFWSTALLRFLLPQACSDRASDTRPSDVLLTTAYLQSWSLLLIEWAVSRLYRFGSPERMLPLTRRLYVTWSISPLGG